MLVKGEEADLAAQKKLEESVTAAHAAAAAAALAETEAKVAEELANQKAAHLDEIAKVQHVQA